MGQPRATQGNPGQPWATHLQFQQNTIFCLVTKGNPPLNANWSYLQPDLTGKPTFGKETQGNPPQYCSKYYDSTFSGQFAQVNPAVTLICSKESQGNPPQYRSKCYESHFSGPIGQVNPAITLICGKEIQGNPPQYRSKCYESPFSGQFVEVNPGLSLNQEIGFQSRTILGQVAQTFLTTY